MCWVALIKILKYTKNIYNTIQSNQIAYIIKPFILHIKNSGGSAVGEILKAYMVPHPPIIIPTVGKGEEKAVSSTIESYHEVGKQIKELAPDVIILTTSHGPAYTDYIHISPAENLKGSFKDFGAPNETMQFESESNLIDSIIEASSHLGIDAGYGGTKGEGLDHGAMVPLYFMTRYYTDFTLIRISIAGLPMEQLYNFGYCIQKAVSDYNKNVVFVASGDLSHRLLEKGPYGFTPEGPIFDATLVNIIKEVNFKKLITIDEELCYKAGECGLRSFVIMAGALNGLSIKSKVLSYEGTFGVGYMVAELTIDGKDLSRDLFSFFESKSHSEVEATKKCEDSYVKLARESLEYYVRTGMVLDPPSHLPPDMINQSKGVFVSIKKHGNLRGCIGTISPVYGNVAEEIIYDAISAGTRDPRFNPVKKSELNDLLYSVDVLEESEPISSIDELDVVKYGVIVTSGHKRGLLLPNLEGIDTPNQQVEMALYKAGISEEEPYEMERFEVIRHN